MLPAGGWRAAGCSVRCRLPDRAVVLRDESGLDLSQEPWREMGDPIVVRRDGAFSYHLAVVVDDGELGVTRIVRGRDLAGATATHVQLQELLGLPVPSYRHHLLLLEPRGDKLAKLHGSIAAPELQGSYTAAELCGVLAHAVGLLPSSEPCKPVDLLDAFDWDCISAHDVVVEWKNARLVTHAIRATDTGSRKDDAH
jgi:glutamyl/glutaminyl-tRNA synthetase